MKEATRKKLIRIYAGNIEAHKAEIEKIKATMLKWTGVDYDRWSMEPTVHGNNCLCRTAAECEGLRRQYEAERSS